MLLWFHIAFLVVLHLASAAQYLMLLRVESFALLRDVVYWLHELAWLLCNAVLFRLWAHLAGRDLHSLLVVNVLHVSQ